MNRYQIIKRTTEGVFRATANDLKAVDDLVAAHEKDPECHWVLVKDRVKNQTVRVWQRDRDCEIQWWIEDL